MHSVLVSGCSMLFFFYPSAHMWFDGDVHGANTDEDPSDPDKTKRVINPYLSTCTYVHVHLLTP